jgi:hypothetical protein
MIRDDEYGRGGACERRSHGREGVCLASRKDCLLRYANNDEVVGRDASEAAIAGFFSTITGISHRIVEQWDVDDTTIVQLEATYTRSDDGQVTPPASRSIAAVLS